MYHQFELTKSQKKKARICIEKGLLKEFESGIERLETIIKDWRNTTADNRETYHKLYSTLSNFDKKISKQYDGMTGSTYLFILVVQLREGHITQADIDEMDEVVIEKVKVINSLYK